MAKVVQIQLVQIQGHAQLQWRAERGTSGRWVGICDAMKLVTEAESLDDLRSVIDETMQVVLTDLLRDNELQQFLRDHGWQAQLPQQADPEEVRFNVPWELIAQGGNDPERRAH